MRNLTKEAIDRAKENLLRNNPHLGDPMFRKNLDAFMKQVIFMELVNLATMYETQLVKQIGNK